MSIKNMKNIKEKKTMKTTLLARTKCVSGETTRSIAESGSKKNKSAVIYGLR